MDRLEGVSNYLIGKDPAKWRHNVPSYRRAKLFEVYPGIDVVFYCGAETSSIEYDFIVRPGADPTLISIDFDQSIRPTHASTGEALQFHMAQGKLSHKIPKVHQNGKALPFAAKLQGNSLRLEVSGYDAAATLTIDPVLIYSTYLAGTVEDSIADIAVDSTGAAYVTGRTRSPDLPNYSVDPQQSLKGTDCFVTKIHGALVGSVYPRIYSTYFGGTGLDYCTGIAVDPTGAAYFTGVTGSTDLPVLAAMQTEPGGMFFAKISGQENGAQKFPLVYSSYLGNLMGFGLEGPRIAVNGSGSAYVATFTFGTPITALHAAQSGNNGDYDVVLVKIAAAPTAGIYGPVYASYLGGSGREIVRDVAVDSAGAAYVVGSTDSINFPTRTPYQGIRKAEKDGFVTKISGTPNGSGVYEIAYSTYLAGPTGYSATPGGNAIAVDANFNAYVGANLADDFPSVNPVAGTIGNARVLKLGTNGNTVLFSTPYGGNLRTTVVNAMAVDNNGVVTMAGTSNASFGGGAFPLVDPPYILSNDMGDMAYAARIATGSSSMIYSVIVTAGKGNGVAVDGAGNAYVAGQTPSGILYVLNGYGAPQEQGGFVVKFGTQPSPPNVNVDSTPSGLSFSVSGSGCIEGTHLTPASLRWPTGLNCTITFPSVQLSGSGRNTFLNWNDNGSTNGVRQITATSSVVTYTANHRLEYSLQTDTLIGAGTVSPAGVSYHNPGASVQVVATPAEGWEFSRWEGTAVVANRTAASTQVTMNNPSQLQAVFALRTSVAGLQFYPVTPCRVSDSRGPVTGPLGSPAFSIGETRSIPIPQSACNIPSNAAAYSLNVTVVPKGLLGYLTIWPTGRERPVVSTLNALDGRVKANAAIVPAGTQGAVSVFVTNDTDVILDINGYFAPPQANGLVFYAIPPCRVSDTRNAAGSFGGPSLAATVARSIPVRNSACGIPASAKAYSLNMTIVPTGPLVGFLSVWPTGVQQPVVSTLNNLTGTIVANAAIVPAGSDASGSIEVYATHGTELLVDINGYFAPPGQTGGLLFYALNPCRVFDSRVPDIRFTNATPFRALEARTYEVPVYPCSAPYSAVAYSVNVSAIPIGTLGYVTVWPDVVGPRPTVSVLNAIDGALTSNAAIVPSGLLGRILIFPTNDTNLFMDINGYFAP